MNKLPPPLSPHEVRMRAGFAFRVAVRVRAVLCVARAGIVGIEQVLPALEVLHVAMAEAAVQLDGGHAQALGYLRGGDSAPTPSA